MAVKKFKCACGTTTSRTGKDAQKLMKQSLKKSANSKKKGR